MVAAGERPAVLSRGYGRRRVADGVVIVSDGVHRLADLDRAGDEPLMIARAAPGAMVLVCDQRAIAGALATHHLGATVLLLDDGFQHRAMRRDVDLVLVTAEDLDDRRIPFGRLRESVRALSRADAVIVDGLPVATTPAAARDLVRARVPSADRVFVLRRSLAAVTPLAGDRAPSPDDGPIVALAGIAHPERFSRMLAAAGWRVAETVAFGDHHQYRREDLTRIAGAVRRSGAVAALTTSKDAIRLLPLRPLPVPIAEVSLDATIDPAESFDEWIFRRLREARG
jgi:tetraacyldisaccharide 4'-kinase